MLQASDSFRGPALGIENSRNSNQNKHWFDALQAFIRWNDFINRFINAIYDDVYKNMRS